MTYEPTDYSGEQGVWRYHADPIPLARFVKMRDWYMDRWKACGSWHPTDPKAFCMDLHTDAISGHHCSGMWWDGPYNDTRATVEPEGATGADRNVQPKEARRG